VRVLTINNKKTYLMKIKNCAVGVTVVSALVVVGVAQAGPEVQVVFKNNGASDAIMTPVAT
jgi:hypothetical protein